MASISTTPSSGCSKKLPDEKESVEEDLATTDAAASSTGCELPAHCQGPAMGEEDQELLRTIVK